MIFCLVNLLDREGHLINLRIKDFHKEFYYPVDGDVTRYQFSFLLPTVNLSYEELTEMLLFYNCRPRSLIILRCHHHSQNCDI